MNLQAPRFLFSVLLAFLTLSSTAQNFNLIGDVVDESNVPLIGVTVRLKNDPTIGTLTDENGRFTLSVPQQAGTLIFSYVGYTDLEVNFGDSEFSGS